MAGLEGDDLGLRTDGAKVKPPEEIIKLSTDAFAESDSRRGPARQGGRLLVDEGDGKGKGKGKGGKGKAAPTERKDNALPDAMRKFARGGLSEKRPKAAPGESGLGGRLKKQASQNRETVYRLAKSEVLQTERSGGLQTEGSLEMTSKVSQAQILEGATLGVAKKKFAYDLPYGPYNIDFTSNGQQILAGGRKGQVAMMDVDSMHIHTEMHLKETVRAVQPLHSYMMFAVAQKKYVHFYDDKGSEIHLVKEYKDITHMDFLPYHFLLVAAGGPGDLFYRDISTGQAVAAMKTKLGPCRSLRQNSQNGVIHMGHSSGVVTMWTPTVKEPVVKLGCHAGHVTSLAIRRDYMMTSGADGYWKVWDLRKYEPVHTFKVYGHAVTDADFSMTGLLAIAFGPKVHVFKDVYRAERNQRPYMTEEYTGKMVNSVRFRPYEDVLGVGHSDGFGGLIVPGAGYANFDSYEANPFENRRQRREREVRKLLEKLQPDSIMLDPNRIGSVDRKIAREYESKRKQEEEQKAAEKQKKKKKMRGKDKVGNKQKRKKLQEGAGQRAKARARIGGEDGSSSSSGEEEDDDDGAEVAAAAKKKAAAAREAAAEATGENRPAPPGTGAALGRFYGKRRRKT